EYGALMRGRQLVASKVSRMVEVSNAEGEAIWHEAIEASGLRLARLADLVGLLHGAPARGPVGLVPRDAPGHVAIVGPRGGEKARATARGGSGREEKGLAALAATDAAENQV